MLLATRRAGDADLGFWRLRGLPTRRPDKPVTFLAPAVRIGVGGVGKSAGWSSRPDNWTGSPGLAGTGGVRCCDVSCVVATSVAVGHPKECWQDYDDSRGCCRWNDSVVDRARGGDNRVGCGGRADHYAVVPPAIHLAERAAVAGGGRAGTVRPARCRSRRGVGRFAWVESSRIKFSRVESNWVEFRRCLRTGGTCRWWWRGEGRRPQRTYRQVEPACDG